MKKLFMVSALSLVASTSFAAPVAGGSSSTLVKAAQSNLMAVGTAGIAMPTSNSPTLADTSKVVSFAAGPINQTNAVIATPGFTSAHITLGGATKISETWKNNYAYNTAVYAYRQISNPQEGFPEFGGEVIAKVTGNEVYFGEWAPRKTGTQPDNSTDLNLSSSSRAVWYSGENPTTAMPTLVNAKYNVVGVKQYNPGTGAGVTSGVLTANYGSGSGTITGTVGTLNFAGTSIASNGTFARSSNIEGRFYGANAQALAGIYKGATAASNIAFGGAKQ
ncbi:MAG: hypothetical protein P0Y58_04870 [Candidatus Pseudomonas phytovorans]|uniref:Transferrin-binding protein B C-lobe/N-lobe beta-barrel domain-containing protein n=1 Tax=Candidatus Pseudomonas phytovorans TaxID=3121377 RepID=A0AAJ6BBI5_9PSED|nr:Slam-dependent surface lipoprotein [Pseudomonas sp.]WEK31535.1 MAG: hypothetical protein P0Y58_04870 [Pseudomonas sp.]